MGKRYGYYVDLLSYKFDDTSNVSWIHAMPIGKYNHPTYGELDFTPERIGRFAASVKNKVRGIDPDIDYDHKARTDEAAGWVKDADARTDGLWLLVDWTTSALSKIKEKAYRYFSPEFDDEWTDNQGNKHQDVLFGGGLTNRPFLKDLIPVNLSELSFGEPSTGGEEVDKKAICKALGLPEDSTDEQVMAKLTEQSASIVTLTAVLANNTQQLSTLQDEVKTLKEPKPGEPQIGDELKQLAETNPTIKALIDQVEHQNKTMAEVTKVLRETQTDARLRELDSSKIILTPTTKELVKKILNEVPDSLTGSVWDLVKLMRDSKTAMVELGERAGGRATFGQDKSADQQFNALVATAMEESKSLSLPDAMELVARENPALYAAYREDSYILKTA